MRSAECAGAAGFSFAAVDGAELLRMVVRNVPVRMAMLDRDLRYVQVSDQFCADHGLRRDEVEGRTAFEIFPNMPERWGETLRRSLSGESFRAMEDVCERQGREPMWIRWAIEPWRGVNGQPTGVLIFSEDITERKRLEASLREREGTIQSLLETAPQAILAVDEKGEIVIANRMAAAMFGFDQEALRGAPLEMLMPARYREGHAGHRSGFAANPRRRPMGIGVDLQGLRSDGSEFPIEVSLSSFESAKGALAVAFITDITLRKQAETALQNSEKELRSLARNLLAVQEDERRRLARDLHDDVVQQLALLSIEIGKLASAAPASARQTAERLRLLQSQSLRVVSDVRRMSHGLHPAVLEDFGLSAALREFCEEFAKSHGVEVEFEGPDTDAAWSAEVASCFYRITQECLRNAIKHAKATRIAVKLEADAECARLEVRDNGAGFDAEGGRTGAGLGMVSMKERMRMMNGVLEVHSQPGEGSAIVARAPLTGGSNEAANFVG
ncbi:MAG TPA: PAS domain S-box protein [Bryobacteraceae bacterium]|nr:PAS domain S-box protein [Bryobacteraceae bacterium]